MTRLRSFRNISICGRSVRPAAFSRFKPQGDRVARYFARNCPVRARVVKGGVRLSNRLSNQVMTTVLSQRASTASRIEYVHCTLFLPGTLSVCDCDDRPACVGACLHRATFEMAREGVRPRTCCSCNHYVLHKARPAAPEHDACARRACVHCSKSGAGYAENQSHGYCFHS